MGIPRVRIGGLASIRRGASPRPIQDPRWFSASGRGWIRISDVTACDTYLQETAQYLSPLGEAKSVRVDPGDLIMSICATIGVPRIVGIPACIHDGFVVFRNYEANLDRMFLFYFLSFISARLANSGQPGTQKNINTTIVGDIEIPKIAIPEQKRIAAILRVWDAAIEQMSNLIQAKQKLKNGLIQELLMGKLRPMGYTAARKHMHLGDVGQFSKGSGISKAEAVAEGFPAIRYGELYTTHHVVIRSIRTRISPQSAKSSRKISRGDILIAGSGETAEDIGKAAVFLGDFEAYAGGDIIILSPKKADALYLSYLLNSMAVRRHILSRAQGQSVVHLYRRDLERLPITLPGIGEQRKIAEILATIDHETALLKAQSGAFRRQKRGLMAKLLMGRIRVREAHHGRA